MDVTHHIAFSPADVVRVTVMGARMFCDRLKGNTYAVSVRRAFVRPRIGDHDFLVRRKRGRSSGSTTEQNRINYQTQDCQSTRPQLPNHTARPRRRGDRMRRRAFIALITGALVGGRPLAARAEQPPAQPLIGILSTRSPEEAAIHTNAFRRGLEDMGYIEGRSVAIEYRWASPICGADRFRSSLRAFAVSQAADFCRVMGTSPLYPQTSDIHRGR